jgi:anti-sigma B factor antagonist
MSDQLECAIGRALAGEPLVVTVRGEVDLATASELESSVQRAFAVAPESVLLDLGGLTFIDSSGLRVLVSLSNEARAREAKLALRNVPRHAERVLDLTGLSEFFDRAPDV